MIATELDRSNRHRKIILAASTKGPKTDQNASVQRSLRPDFVVADVSPGTQGKAQRRAHHSSLFIEIKFKETDTPALGPQKAIRDTLTQITDYAGHIFVNRPFQVFVLGAVIHGSSLTLAYFDRAGVVLSKEHTEIYDAGLPELVRLVWSLLNLDPVQLGLDPTVSLVDGCHFYDETIPEFVVTRGSDTLPANVWTTRGRPLFVSHTIFGRGTTVWRVYGEQGSSIMKISWRHPGRPSEGDVYLYLESGTRVGTKPPSIASWLDGGDVFYPLPDHDTGARETLDCQSLRRRWPESEPGQNLILSRIHVRPLGKELWKFRHPGDLAEGLLDILDGTSCYRLSVVYAFTSDLQATSS